MNEKEEVNGLSNIHTDTNRDSKSAFPNLIGQVAADCENLGQTLSKLADSVAKLHTYQDNLSRELIELRVKLRSYESFKEKV